MILAMDGDTRTCRTCKIEKSVDEFYVKKAATTKTGFQRAWSCKPCQSAKARQWSKDNPERRNRNRWLYELKSRYGMTEQSWENLLRKQGGGCAICGAKEDGSRYVSGVDRRMSVDHCHETGRVRGILCNRCNRAIGLLKDNVQLLERAIGYLKE
jgi:hypothetical protein